MGGHGPYSCSGIISFGNKDYVAVISGEHRDGKSYDDVEILGLQSQNLTSFPTNIETFLQNLDTIDVSYNLITQVTNAHFRPHKKLSRLYLNDNQISKNDANIFDDLPNLKFINLGCNNIKYVGNGIQLARDGVIIFHKNPCIDMIAGSPLQVDKLKIMLGNQCSLDKDQDALDNVSELNSYQEKAQNIVNKTDDWDYCRKYFNISCEQVINLQENYYMLQTNQKTLNQNVKVMGEEIVRLYAKKKDLEKNIASIERRFASLEASMRDLFALNTNEILIETANEEEKK